MDSFPFVFLCLFGIKQQVFSLPGATGRWRFWMNRIPAAIALIGSVVSWRNRYNQPPSRKGRQKPRYVPARFLAPLRGAEFL